MRFASMRPILWRIAPLLVALTVLTFPVVSSPTPNIPETNSLSNVSESGFYDRRHLAEENGGQQRSAAVDSLRDAPVALPRAEGHLRVNENVNEHADPDQRGDDEQHAQIAGEELDERSPGQPPALRHVNNRQRLRQSIENAAADAVLIRYPCHCCDHLCNSEKQLKRHYQDKHEDQVFVCHSCWQLFPRNERFSKHCRRRHGRTLPVRRQQKRYALACGLCREAVFYSFDSFFKHVVERRHRESRRWWDWRQQAATLLAQQAFMPLWQACMNELSLDEQPHFLDWCRDNTNEGDFLERLHGNSFTHKRLEEYQEDVRTMLWRLYSLLRQRSSMIGPAPRHDDLPQAAQSDSGVADAKQPSVIPPLCWDRAANEPYAPFLPRVHGCCPEAGFIHKPIDCAPTDIDAQTLVDCTMANPLSDAAALASSSMYPLDNPAMARLRETVTDGVLPAETSSEGLRCGLHALLGSLNDLLARNAGLDQIPVPLDIATVTQAVWTRPNEPTPAYEAFVRNRLRSVRQDLGEPQFAMMRQELTQSNMFGIEQLTAITDFLLIRGLLPYPVAVGVVTAGARVDERGLSGPSVQVLGDHQPGTPVAWLHNDNGEQLGQSVSHWSMFRTSGDRPDLLIGLPLPLHASLIDIDIATPAPPMPSGHDASFAEAQPCPQLSQAEPAPGETDVESAPASDAERDNMVSQLGLGPLLDPADSIASFEFNFDSDDCEALLEQRPELTDDDGWDCRPI
ncbi:hypothetical protein BAUCODRAFT_311550 [Baudoinia panamericana UAMH 10762]|uniref:C2H2-type domain-containing protein n=1 Tax=Baudoinia panamericana (strain UAMH 10762) TaxID=717646 RepID=M2MKS3_BAUPA|nr:uncharacterized protein BAUCODRAFT_311550 [Baudoinia panamericana UAMH 10762]EMC91933.1 hypothetical protein BAUCODRAFT_311550 [Baudoinia panamericana UAMH 10762]